jgi:hypothetical protein
MAMAMSMAPSLQNSTYIEWQGRPGTKRRATLTLETRQNIVHVPCVAVRLCMVLGFGLGPGSYEVSVFRCT